MARFLCDFYVYKAPQQLVAKYVNAILTEGEAQASANSLLKQHGAKFVCVEKKSSASGAPRAPIKSSATGNPTQPCWVVAPQVAAQTVTCPPGYVFEGGKCVIKSPIPPKCPPGTKLDLTGKLCVPILKTGPGGRVLRKPGIVAGPFDQLEASAAARSRPQISPTYPRNPFFPFSLGNVGDPPSVTSKYKGILLLWSKSPGVSSPVPNFGTLIEDLSPTWNCMREGRMLSGFSKWWNSKGGNKISEGYFPTSGTCKGILVADLDAQHMAALDAFAAGATAVVDPNAAGQWPTTNPTASVACTDQCQQQYGAASAGGLNLVALLACLAECAKTGMPPIQPIPGGGAQPPPGGAPPPGGGLPPPPAPKPPQGGTPPPSGVTDCDGKNPCPAGQVCVGGKCQPALPPPPVAPGSTTKSSNTGLWIAGGVAVLGAAALIFGGGKSSLLLNPYARPGERVRHLQYREALAAFKRRYAGPKNDKPRMGEAWSRYIDELARSGLITEAQASRWDNPFYR